MRQIIGLMQRAGRWLGVLGKKRGRHTAAYLAEMRQQRGAPVPELPERRRHAASVAPREFRPQRAAAAPGVSQARGVLTELRRETTPPVRARGPRTAGGAQLHVMPRAALPDSVAALAERRKVVPASMLPSRWAAPDEALFRVLLDGLAKL